MASQKPKPRYCPNVRSLLLSDDFKEGYIALSRMRCKQWSCPFCAIKNADMWRAHLLETLGKDMAHKRWVFITLTATRRAHVSALLTLKNLKEGWGKLYDRLRYKYGRGFSYVMLYEQHKRGTWHVHALIDLGAEYDAHGVTIDPSLEGKDLIRAEKRHPFCKDLKEMCVRSGIGYVVHARRIREGNTSGDNVRLAVGYVTKYFTKQIDIQIFPKHARRIGTSRDIGSPKTRNKQGFHWWVRTYVMPDEIKVKPHFLIAESRLLGPSDFGDEGVYPSSTDDVN